MQQSRRRAAGGAASTPSDRSPAEQGSEGAGQHVKQRRHATDEETGVLAAGKIERPAVLLVGLYDML